MIELYEYQKKYLSDLPSRSIMAADTGTGKTFMALAHYERHAGGARHAGIFADVGVGVDVEHVERSGARAARRPVGGGSSSSLRAVACVSRAGARSAAGSSRPCDGGPSRTGCRPWSPPAAAR